jgi:putative hydrolase of the HAD superfamily
LEVGRIGMKVTTLFLDVGGVLLTNGWDRGSRTKAARHFGLDLTDLNSRHSQTFDTYEVGKTSLEEYLERVVFYKKRKFTVAQFQTFMFHESKAYPEMIDLVCGLKIEYGLKIAVVSNEGRELNAYRIKKFTLGRFVDFFISSCFVHLRKPDQDIYRLALDVAQVPASEVLYIEDRPMFVQVAKDLGIRGICHSTFKETKAQLAKLGLK